MTTLQAISGSFCVGFVILSLSYMYDAHQVMSAIFFAVLALAFAVLFDGLREYEK